MTERACDRCVTRTWLVGRLAAHLEHARGRLEQVLGLDEDELIESTGGQARLCLRRELAAIDVSEVRARSLAAGLETICRCDPDYPPALRALATPPAVLHVAGGLRRLLELGGRDPVSIVGSRRGSDYGLGVARSLGHGLAVAGVPVISGMALGIDSAAHAGALEAAGPTVAVLPGSADRPYPAAKRALYRRIVAGGAAVSELAPGTSVWRWMFLARNRIIAALAAMTVVVEAGERSGAMVTARLAREIGRPVGAVPGRVTTPQAAGVKLAGPGERRQPPAELRALLQAITAGHETAAALARAGFTPDQSLAALAALELGGFVRRGAGGRFSVVP